MHNFIYNIYTAHTHIRTRTHTYTSKKYDHKATN